MKKDPIKERQANVSGSSNKIYTEEVKITGDRYTSKDFMEKELSKAMVKSLEYRWLEQRIRKER
jgi:uncharacterized surface anchored protein